MCLCFSNSTQRVGCDRPVNIIKAITPRSSWNTAKVGVSYQSINRYPSRILTLLKLSSMWTTGKRLFVRQSWFILCWLITYYRHDINVWCSLHVVLSLITVGCKNFQILCWPFPVEWKYVLLYLFSETTGPVGTKLRRNVHCTVLLHDCEFMGNMHTQKQEAHELFLPQASNGEPIVIYPPWILTLHNRLKFFIM